MKDQDNILVERFKNGDQSALNLLVKKWHLAFCKKAYWIIKDADLSKDIAQECWQIIIDKISGLQDNSSFASWAMRIVYNKSFDMLRKQNADRLKKQRLRFEFHNNSPDESQNSDLQKTIYNAIKNLSVPKQEVLKLFYLEEYSLKEISKMLNISEGTVKSRLFHAREKLKIILKSKKYEN